MKCPMIWWVGCGALLTVVACDCDDSAPGGNAACESDDPTDGCDAACDQSNPCGLGLQCRDGRCEADCNADSPCPTGFVCNFLGACEPVAPSNDGGLPPGVCATIELAARPVTPNVLLIVDQSGSMRNDFEAGRSRWVSLQQALLAQPDGLVASLQEQVRFGLALYSAESEDDENVDGVCPMLTDVNLALRNYEGIASVYNAAEPVDETPTGDALMEILDRLGATPDPDVNPTIFILATDGEPDTCEQPNPQRGQEEAIDAVTEAFRRNIRTFVISVGEGSVSRRHLQDLANAGLGRGPGDPDADFWVAGNEDGLGDALREIVGGVVSCDVILDGRIDPAEACTGSVRLNGRELTCDGPDGWSARSDNRIEIRGEACEELQGMSGAILEATFPCNIVLI